MKHVLPRLFSPTAPGVPERLSIPAKGREMKRRVGGWAGDGVGATHMLEIPYDTYIAGGRGVLMPMHGRSRITGPSHPYNTGTEHARVSLTRHTMLVPSVKRREVFGESREGRAASHQY